MNLSGGQVTWIFDAETGQFNRAIIVTDKNIDHLRKNIANTDKSAKSSISRMANSAGELGSSFDSVANSLGTVLRTAIAVGASGSLGIGAMVKASFDQVRAVENARASMIGFGASIEDVDKVMRETVAFVRSERGTLFQRQDILATTAALQGMGVSLETVSRDAQTVAKATIPAGASFEEINDIIRTVGAEGKISADSFARLAARGIFLDDSLRGTTSSAEDLLAAMEQALPDSLIDGRANTIDGALIQTQSAFRDLGAAILGVDSETSEFLEGGLGDVFVSSLADLRKSLSDPALREGFADIGAGLAEFAKEAIPVIQNVFQWIVSNWGTIVNGILALGAAFVTAKIGSSLQLIGAAFSAGPFGVIAASITTLVGVLVFLENEFGAVTNTINFLVDVFNNIVSAVNDVGSEIGSFVDSSLTNLNNVFNSVRDTVQDLISSGLSLLDSALNTISSAIQTAINWFIEYRQWFINIGIVAATILGPALVRVGAIAVTQAARAAAAWITSGARTTASFIATAAAATVNAVRAGAIWAAQATVAAARWLVQLPRIIAQMAITAAQASVNAVIAGAAWIAQASLVAARWAVTFAAMLVGMARVTAQFIINAVRIGAGWLLALGPIGAIVAVVAGVVALIIANWDSLQAVFQGVWDFLTGLWSGITDFFTGLWEGVVAVTQAIFNGLVVWFTGVIAVYRQIFTSIGDFFVGVWNGAVNTVRGVFNGLTGFFQGFWNNIVGLFGRIGSAIGDTIGGAVRGAINAVLNGAVGIINGFIDAINFAIDAINAIPGVDIGRLDHLNVPQLANGGIISSATLAVVGEGSEPEAVIPLSRLNTMLNEASGSGDGRREAVINQTNNVYTPLDMRLVNRNLTWELNRS